METVRTVVRLAVRNGLKLHQLEITTAFLNGELKEDIYMRQLKGFIADGQEHLVCKQKRSIYGFKVDDIVIACKSDMRLKQIKQDLCKKFNVKDLGKLRYFLGMKSSKMMLLVISGSVSLHMLTRY